MALPLSTFSSKTSAQRVADVERLRQELRRDLAQVYASLNELSEEAEARLVELGGASGTVIVREIDGAPIVTCTTIECTNGTVTDMGGGVARLAIGGGGGLDFTLVAAMHHLGVV